MNLTSVILKGQGFTKPPRLQIFLPQMLAGDIPMSKIARDLYREMTFKHKLLPNVAKF